MNPYRKVESIQKRVVEIKDVSKVRFFDSQKEHDQAHKNNLIGINDICFIDDIPKG